MTHPEKSLHLVPPYEEPPSIHAPVRLSVYPLPGADSQTKLVNDLSEITERQPVPVEDIYTYHFSPSNPHTHHESIVQWPGPDQEPQVRIMWDESRKGQPTAPGAIRPGNKPAIEHRLARADLTLGIEGPCLTAILVYLAKRWPDRFGSEIYEPSPRAKNLPDNHSPGNLSIYPVINFPAPHQLPESDLLEQIEGAEAPSYWTNTVILPGQGFVWKEPGGRLSIGSTEPTLPRKMAHFAQIASLLNIAGSERTIAEIFGGSPEEVQKAIDMSRLNPNPLEASLKARDYLLRQRRK